MKGILMGFGNMGKTHLERYKLLDVNMHAIVETDETKKQEARSQGFQVFDSLLGTNAEEADFIDICSPTNLHFGHLLDAMSYRKPIFVEKPVVLRTGEARELRRMSYEHPIFVGEVEQYNPDIIPFINHKGKTRIINISRRVNLEFFLKGTEPWFLDESLSGGIVLDAMIHDINLLVFKYGKPTLGPASYGAAKYICPDNVRVKLFFDGGIEANLSCSWTARELTKTPIVVDIALIEEGNKRKNFYCDNYIIRDKPREQDAFYMEIKAFLESIKNGRTPFSLEGYLVGIEVANQIRERIR